MQVSVPGLANLGVLVGVLARHVVPGTPAVPILILLPTIRRNDIDFFDIVRIFLLVRQGIPRRCVSNLRH